MRQDQGPVAFPVYLKEAIDGAGFETPSQFARQALNTDPSTVLRWLSGEARPSIRLLERIAPVLGRDINELVAAAYPEAVRSKATSAPLTRVFHPLASEVDRMLDPESPLTDDERQRVIVVVEAGIEKYRPKMRARRRRAG